MPKRSPGLKSDTRRDAAMRACPRAFGRSWILAAAILCASAAACHSRRSANSVSGHRSDESASLLARLELDVETARQLHAVGEYDPCSGVAHRRPVPVCTPTAPVPWEKPLRLSRNLIDECTAVRLAEGYLIEDGWTVAPSLHAQPLATTFEERRACIEQSDEPETLCLQRMMNRRVGKVVGKARGVCSLAFLGLATLVYFETREGTEFAVAVDRCGNELEPMSAPIREGSVGLTSLLCYRETSRQTRGVVSPLHFGGGGDGDAGGAP